MTQFKHRLPYSAIVDRPPLRLPGGARVVVWTIVNVEVWDAGGPMPRAVMPAPGGTPLIPDLPNWAWHEYGMRVGFWRLKAMLDRHKVTATLSINGAVCKEYPRIAGAARDAGWEFMGHGYVQKPMHLLGDQGTAIAEAVAAIRDFTGKGPRGWLGPGLTETAETVDLLAAQGIEYIADWVLDDQPCELASKHGPVFTMPYTVELSDLAITALQHHRSDALLERAMDQFETLHAEGGDQARIMAIALHPYISGVPHRIRYVEEIYARLAAKPDVLFWTGAQILDWYRGAAR